MRSYIIGERNCGSYNHCTTSTQFLQLIMMMIKPVTKLQNSQDGVRQNHPTNLLTARDRWLGANVGRQEVDVVFAKFSKAVYQRNLWWYTLLDLICWSVAA
ncbi:hypothetical protein CRM22_010659 [Opisthorchis felineus]|uniref:Uncharacterized protein n=1 Tax=Opisthorchis felineus TaxID=147828 RepID=A0A4S2KW52_OPIFE|nr:hypothetical protein CRM22_010659 [Opisthorchis felineus]